MKKVFGILLIAVAALFFLCTLFLTIQLINHSSSTPFNAYNFGYIIGSLFVIIAETVLAIFMFKKGKNLVTSKQ
jgi:hypothetical protein